MNRTPTILAGLALLGVLILFILHFRGNTQSGGTTRNTSNMSSAGGSRIAFVDIDSFETRYESLKKKKEDFKVQQDAMESELQRSAQQMQADYANVVHKQQSGTLTQSEGEAAQKRLAQMQQSLETRKEAMTVQFQEKLDAFNKALHADMDAFLKDYVKDHHYDYVLSYSSSNAQTLYADPALNITADVIKGMNERAAKGGSFKDTAKSK